MNSSLFICYPKALLTSISLPMEMIAAAVSVARIKRHPDRIWNCYAVAAQTETKETIEYAKGLSLLPKFNLNDAPQADIIFLPPIWGKPDVIVDKSPYLIDWLKERYQQGTQLCATGTGVGLLAKAGLLDGQMATTHWYYFEEFAKKYPQVNLQKNHFITQAERLFCCGSINALVDLTLYFIEEKFGVEVSQVIEQHFSHEVNRTFDKPWYASGETRHRDEVIIEVQDWMRVNQTATFELELLAERANMSVRNFSRRFKAATGLTALAYATELKMQFGKELLKETNLNHQAIADKLGFKDAAYFARQFKLKNKITPGEYRAMVRGKLFNL